MSLTLPEQDCRNVVIYFEVLLKKMKRGYILDEHDFRDYKDQLNKFKECFEVKECQNISQTQNLDVNVDVA